MKRFLTLFFILQAILLSAQTTENALLWKISGNGLEEESYLLGTIHILPKAEYELSDSINKYLELSETLMLEIDLDISLKDQVNMAKRMMLPEGVTIKDYMHEDDYSLLMNYLRDSLEIKEMILNQAIRMKPAFFGSIILPQMIEKPVAVDSELFTKAKKKNFVALETIDDQLNMIDSIPFEDHLAFKGDDYKMDKEYYKLKDLYLAADVQGLETLLLSSIDSEIMEYMLFTKRNLNWIPKIEDAIAESATFIGVGAGHLLGENGLLMLLKSEGYELSPIYF